MSKHNGGAAILCTDTRDAMRLIQSWFAEPGAICNLFWGAGADARRAWGSWGKGRRVPMRAPRQLRSATRVVGRAVEWTGTDHSRQVDWSAHHRLGKPACPCSALSKRLGVPAHQGKQGSSATLSAGRSRPTRQAGGTIGGLVISNLQPSHRRGSRLSLDVFLSLAHWQETRGVLGGWCISRLGILHVRNTETPDP
jgi:hypothetical protein